MVPAVADTVPSIKPHPWQAHNLQDQRLQIVTCFDIERNCVVVVVVVVVAVVVVVVVLT